MLGKLQSVCRAVSKTGSPVDVTGSTPCGRSKSSLELLAVASPIGVITTAPGVPESGTTVEITTTAEGTSPESNTLRSFGHGFA
jgi:hypothetical protein